MNNIAIRVEQLSKLYSIGPAYRRHDTLRDQISSALAGLFHRNGKTEDETRFWALQDVSFDVKPGEVVGIVGRNGAGKSTLLKILSRITEPTKGSALIHGRVGSLLEVGTGFHPELSGRENIYLNGALLGMKKAEIARKFDEIVAFAEIEKFMDTPVKRYSSGMYVRLAFAVAAHLEPEVLIVDEVLAVGDAGFQKKCLGKMEDVGKAGRTVLFVSHNMAAVTQLCGHAVWLENGRTRKIGTAEEVVKEYMTDNNEQIAERRWSYPGDAPGDERVRLLAIRMVQNDQVTSVIDINVPSRIEFEFEVLQDIRNLVSGILLDNALGTCLFDSCDWRPNHLTPGRYRKYVELPAQLLAEGRIDLTIHLYSYEEFWESVYINRVLVADCIDSDHPLSVRGLYKGGPWPGVVRVRLPWSEAVKCDERLQNRPADEHVVSAPRAR